LPKAPTTDAENCPADEQKRSFGRITAMIVTQQDASIHTKITNTI